MNSPNAWKRGIEKLRPGLYVDAKGALHSDSRKLLEALGCEPALQNEAWLERYLRENSRKLTTVEEEPSGRGTDETLASDYGAVGAGEERPAAPQMSQRPATPEARPTPN
jgi:hypothetical protein